MAIQKTVMSGFGIVVTDAYHRVENVCLITKDRISFQIRSRVSKDTSIFSEAVASCDYDLNGDNPIAQAYKHLKTLPEYADAIDC